MGVSLKVSPDYISHLLKVPCVTQDPIAFPIHKLSMEQKGAWVERLCGWFSDYSEKLSHKDYRLIVQVLHRIFSYNILTTTNRSSLTDDTTYLIDAIQDSQRIDLPFIISYMMIRAHELMHSSSNFPYPTFVTHIMQVKKVPFKVAPKG